MRLIVSIFFWLFFAVSCALFFFIAVALWIVTTPFDLDRRLNHRFSCFWGAMYAVVYPGWRVRVTGRERIEHGHAYVLVANHTSVADIVLLFCLHRQFKWVSKTAVFAYPFLGWNMWLCRYVPLRRGDKEHIAKMMDRCLFWLRRGMSVLMFPEGTRSHDGTLKPFKHGAFTMAIDTKVPVLPIAIHGGHLLIPKHSRTFAARADLWVEILDPIPSTSETDPAVFGESVRTVIRAALDRTNPTQAESPAAADAAAAGEPDQNVVAR